MVQNPLKKMEEFRTLMLNAENDRFSEEQLLAAVDYVGDYLEMGKDLLIVLSYTDHLEAPKFDDWQFKPQDKQYMKIGVIRPIDIEKNSPFGIVQSYMTTLSRTVTLCGGVVA